MERFGFAFKCPYTPPAHRSRGIFVDTGEVLVAGLIYLAFALNVVVVAGEAEAAVVAGDERGDGEGFVLAGRRTVNND